MSLEPTGLFRFVRTSGVVGNEAITDATVNEGGRNRQGRGDSGGRGEPMSPGRPENSSLEVIPRRAHVRHHFLKLHRRPCRLRGQQNRLDVKACVIG